MSFIPNNIGAFIFVDFAHTPDALEKVLLQGLQIKTNSGLQSSRLICVFGCGGDRDSSKRPQMAKVASKYCDFVIITSDNPRTENPSEIISQIKNGFLEVNFDKFIEIESRQTAVKHSVEMLQKNDILIIAGKGHENYQIIGTTKYDYNDRDEVIKNL
jgi:UDP-N-acetylmuramoyl-L-alanyl-D-glutamate--2,6-diaminopimelate ligase